MNERSIAKAAGAVSIGSLVVQAGGVLGQFLYAIWLTPADFGLWATASASVALVGSLINAGEANGYLAGRSIGISGPFRRATAFNYVLAAVGFLVAISYAVFVDMDVAVLIALLACGLPLRGRGAMLIAVFIKTRNQSRLISYQMVGTLARLLMGICVAAIWHSPLALALAYVTYSLVLVVLGHMWLTKTAPHLKSIRSDEAGSRTVRIDRGVHQFSQTLPHQIGYLTASIFASAQLLGLYFFAYQATSAISGVMASPLSKATMAELSKVDHNERVPLVWRFLVLMVGIVGLLVAIAGFILEPLSDLIGERWQDVLAPLVILLASLPARFVLPITEALYMVNARWRQSISINLVDTCGISLSAIVALVTLDGDVVVLAAAITLWKTVFGNFRALVSLAGRRLLTLWAIVVPNFLFVSIFALSVVQFGYFHLFAFLAVILIVSVQIFIFVFSILQQRKNRTKIHGT